MAVEVFLRIASRYLAPMLALYFGMPGEIVAEVLEDPDVLYLAGIVLTAAIGAIETWYLMAKRRGRST